MGEGQRSRRSRRVAGGALVLGASAFAIACGAFGAADESPSEGDAGAADGGADVDPAHPDADPAQADAGAAGFCATHPATLCDDFDTTPLGMKWTQRDEIGGKLSLVGSTLGSLPSALSATVSAAAPQTTNTARLMKDFPPTSSKASLALTVDTSKLPTSGFNNFIAVAEIDCYTDPSYHGVWLAWYANAGNGSPGLGVVLNGATQHYPIATTTSTPRIEIDAEWSAGGLTATVRVDGNVLLDHQLDTTSTCAKDQNADVIVGLSTKNVQATAVYDDVLFDVSP